MTTTTSMDVEVATDRVMRYLESLSTGQLRGLLTQESLKYVLNDETFVNHDDVFF